MELPEYLDKYLDARFKGLESELGSLRDSMDARFRGMESELGSLRDSMDARFRGMGSELSSLKDSFESLKETVRLANENNARLVEMIQRQVLSQDQRIEDIRKELSAARRFFVATLMAGLGVTITIMSLIFQVLR